MKEEIVPFVTDTGIRPKTVIRKAVKVEGEKVVEKVVKKGMEKAIEIQAMGKGLERALQITAMLCIHILHRTMEKDMVGTAMLHRTMAKGMEERARVLVTGLLATTAMNLATSGQTVRN
jgi:hypothetical protein